QAIRLRTRSAERGSNRSSAAMRTQPSVLDTDPQNSKWPTTLSPLSDPRAVARCGLKLRLAPLRLPDQTCRDGLREGRRPQGQSHWSQRTSRARGAKIKG